PGGSCGNDGLVGDPGSRLVRKAQPAFTSIEVVFDLARGHLVQGILAEMGGGVEPALHSLTGNKSAAVMVIGPPRNSCGDEDVLLSIQVTLRNEWGPAPVGCSHLAV